MRLLVTHDKDGNITSATTPSADIEMTIETEEGETLSVVEAPSIDLESEPEGLNRIVDEFRVEDRSGRAELVPRDRGQSKS